MADPYSSGASTPPSRQSEDPEFDPSSAASRKRKRSSKSQQTSVSKRPPRCPKKSRTSQDSQSSTISHDSPQHPSSPNKNSKKKTRSPASNSKNTTSPRTNTTAHRRTKSSEVFQFGDGKSSSNPETRIFNSNRTLKTTSSQPVLSFSKNTTSSSPTIDEFWLDILAESVAWTFIPTFDKTNETNHSIPAGNIGFWWPVIVPVDVYLRPLPLEVFTDLNGEILDYLINKECPVFQLAEPKHSNLLSFLDPKNNLCRFNQENYILSPGDSSSFTVKFPSKLAFQSALAAASARKCEEDGDLPDIGTESVLSIARRSMITKDEENAEETEREEYYNDDGGNVSTDNDDPGPEDIHIGDTVIACWPHFKKHHKRQSPSQKEAFLKAVASATSRNELPQELKEEWWPAKVTEYIPPPKRRKRKEHAIPGSYILTSMDNKRAIFYNRHYFASISDSTFRKAIIGTYKVEGEIQGSNLVGMLDSLVQKLTATIQGNYPHDSGRHNRFLTSNTKEKRLSLHQNTIHHGTFHTSTIDSILDWLSRWVNRKTIPPRSKGCETFEELNEVERQNYASEVLLPLILELLLIDMGEYEKRVLERDGVEFLPDASWDSIPLTDQRKNETLGNAHQMAIEELRKGDWVSEIVSQHTFLTKDVFTKADDENSKQFYDFAVRPRRKAAERIISTSFANV